MNKDNLTEDDNYYIIKIKKGSEIARLIGMTAYGNSDQVKMEATKAIIELFQPIFTEMNKRIKKGII